MARPGLERHSIGVRLGEREPVHGPPPLLGPDLGVDRGRLQPRVSHPVLDQGDRVAGQRCGSSRMCGGACAGSASRRRRPRRTGPASSGRPGSPGHRPAAPRPAAPTRAPGRAARRDPAVSLLDPLPQARNAARPSRPSSTARALPPLPAIVTDARPRVRSTRPQVSEHSSATRIPVWIRIRTTSLARWSPRRSISFRSFLCRAGSRLLIDPRGQGQVGRRVEDLLPEAVADRPRDQALDGAQPPVDRRRLRLPRLHLLAGRRVLRLDQPAGEVLLEVEHGLGVDGRERPAPRPGPPGTTPRRGPGPPGTTCSVSSRRRRVRWWSRNRGHGVRPRLRRGDPRASGLGLPADSRSRALLSHVLSFLKSGPSALIYTGFRGFPGHAPV